MTAAVVRETLEAAGLEVVASSDFSVVAEGPGAFVHALQFPKGWRLQNARESRAATVAELGKRPEDVARFVAGLQAGGAR